MFQLKLGQNKSLAFKLDQIVLLRVNVFEVLNRYNI